MSRKKSYESYWVRLPFATKILDQSYHNSFILTDIDINNLKEKAESEGRTLGKYIAFHLKKIAQS